MTVSFPFPDTAAHPAVIDAVIFDCDGTLVDSEPLLLRVMVAEAVKLGMPPTMAADVAEFEGRSMASSLQLLESRFGRPFPPGFEALLRAEMATLFRAELRPIAGAVEMLAALHVPFCVASNGPRDKTELTLGLTGLLPLFAGRIHSAFEVGAFKPDPALFLHAAAAMGVAPERCAVVEDSVFGIRAGLAAGMHVYAYRDIASLPTDLASRVLPLGRLTDLCAATWNRPRETEGAG